MGSTIFLADDLVALVPLEDQHVPTMVRWINDQAVLQYLMIPGRCTEDQEREWLQNLRNSQSDIVLGITVREDGRHVGNVGLHSISPTNQHAEYGIMIGERDYWGKGLGTAAGRLMLDYGFNQLNLHRIHLRVFSFNPRGISSYEKLGFQHEGRLREHVFRNGVHHDEIQMGLMREEFNEKWQDWRTKQRERYGLDR